MSSLEDTSGRGDGRSFPFVCLHGRRTVSALAYHPARPVNCHLVYFRQRFLPPFPSSRRNTKADLPEFYVSKRVTLSTTRRLPTAAIPSPRVPIPRRPLSRGRREKRVHLTRAESFLVRASESPREDRCAWDVRLPSLGFSRFYSEIAKRSRNHPFAASLFLSPSH